MSRVVLESITKQYPGGVEAVSDVSLVVDDGEFVTLVGPSGCGKTTTLRTIAGFEQPTNGFVGINENRVNTVPPDKRDIGMVFQDFALFPHKTVAENIAYGLKVRGYESDHIDNRVDEMLKLVELPETRERMPDQLSGGQQQRIALARAVAPEPDVLLLDEPLASLDKKLRETMQVELRRIQRTLDITTILVTHNQKEALTMSDRIVVMNDGNFEQVGAPKTVYSNPETPFVADFVGTANIFTGSVSAVDGDTATIDCGHTTIHSTDTDDVAIGDSVSAVFRPEHLSIADPQTATDGAGDQRTVFDGTVSVSRYTGDQIEYHVHTETDEQIVAVQRVAETNIVEGSDVSLELSAENCLLLDQ
ncbi:MAG: ABC-type spermidine/putrescine transport system, ATPase component [uncultured archaeon A07HN63]|nr:MAG: ABC-type spermidine/putrescine transport system, ATPase component [uncultured archaeon A07HN63]